MQFEMQVICTHFISFHIAFQLAFHLKCVKCARREMCERKTLTMYNVIYERKVKPKRFFFLPTVTLLYIHLLPPNVPQKRTAKLPWFCIASKNTYTSTCSIEVGNSLCVTMDINASHANVIMKKPHRVWSRHQNYVVRCHYLLGINPVKILVLSLKRETFMLNILYFCTTQSLNVNRS